MEENKEVKKRTNVTGKKDETKKKTTKSISNTNKNTTTTTKKTTKSKKSIEPTISAGDKSCYIYFDAKLTSNNLNSEILSFTLIDYMSNIFYAEINDVTSEVSDENQKYADSLMDIDESRVMDKIYIVKGNTLTVKLETLQWLKKVLENIEHVQIVCDGNYIGYIKFLEFICGKESFKNIPKEISPCMYDINQDLATSISRYKPEDVSDEDFNKNFIPVLTASEIDREEFIKSFTTFEYNFTKYSSIYTAITTMLIHKYLWNLN